MAHVTEEAELPTEREACVTHQQNVFDPVLWLPVSFESVDTNGSILGHVGVEDLGQEETYRAVSHVPA